MTNPSDATAWMKELSQRIALQVRTTRDKQGLSAAELAERTNGAITRDTIANIESRKQRPINVAELIILAKALGVPPLSLIYPYLVDSPVDDAPGMSATNGEAALAFCGYLETDDDTDLLPLFRLHDAREWYRDDSSPEARQSLKSAVRAAKSRGWTVSS
ncbi:hypothetical protein A4G30_16155 [Mycobacterium kansasii]|uniref:Helix-turn-helix n=1 Tax=Mycobacterium kansasii TaxID=1768 RepID=A0A653F7G6_MYCKA|nr:helix-turn-helix domain-containing protein [Mycobacterium kansasii]ARG75774.1 transcriptional regulator [Mycobacterium kansasii]ARG81313.1 transcriptional regulator [Mycobacterium kansasii]ARG93402.1 transcriptional regulator [Mycobacterium kansasii]KZS76309.1 hypothetical protein A4G30_16155 [Mycobacterium kansasii]VTP05081.1 Helix-turn-helix [Mycobacterium kansasii]